MKTVAVTEREGGDWVPFVPRQMPKDDRGRLVHSIQFDDGSVWDAHNGWRKGQHAFTGS